MGGRNGALAGTAGLGEPVLQRPYEVKDGKLQIPDVPGIGLEWDEKVVATHLADSF